MKERIRPILTTEEQLVVVFHLVGPFLQRFNTEPARKVFDVTIELYEALAKVSIGDWYCKILIYVFCIVLGPFVSSQHNPDVSYKV